MGKCLFMRKGQKHTAPVKPNTQFYIEGNECVSTTGGWEAIGLGINSTYNKAVAPSITKSADKMILKQTQVYGYDCGVVKTVKKIPLKKANKVYFDIEAANEGSAIIGCVILRDIGNTVEDSSVKNLDVSAYAVETVRGVFSIDVSTVTDSCYIGVSMYQGSTVIVKRIWAE